jgi:hypothetical protein
MAGKKDMEAERITFLASAQLIEELKRTMDQTEINNTPQSKASQLHVYIIAGMQVFKQMHNNDYANLVAHASLDFVHGFLDERGLEKTVNIKESLKKMRIGSHEIISRKTGELKHPEPKADKEVIKKTKIK